jgi:dolichol-phosphate mannosyltransferase
LVSVIPTCTAKLKGFLRPRGQKVGGALTDEGTHGVPADPVAVIIPTYNERENLAPIVGRVRTSVPRADVLVVDDASPDGTGEIADQIAATDPFVHVMHRTGKSGLGAAYIAGFRWALDRGYGAIVEMDADGSHQPEQLPGLLIAAEHADLVIGSRWVPGGCVVNWPWHRQILSRSGNTYVRLMLGVGLRDATGGYRVYRGNTLRRIDLDQVQSQGYCFQVDLTLRTLQAGMTAVEVPITFVERSYGSSKMSRNIVIEALWMVTHWGIAARLSNLRKAFPLRRAPTSRSSDA